MKVQPLHCPGCSNYLFPIPAADCMYCMTCNRSFSSQFFDTHKVGVINHTKDPRCNCRKDEYGHSKHSTWCDVFRFDNKNPEKSIQDLLDEEFENMFLDTSASTGPFGFVIKPKGSKP